MIIRSREKQRDAASPCFNIFLALTSLLPPIWWAACTEKPVAAPLHRPLRSQVLVDTTPIEAEACAQTSHHRLIDILHENRRYLSHNSRNTHLPYNSQLPPSCDLALSLKKSGQSFFGPYLFLIFFHSFFISLFHIQSLNCLSMTVARQMPVRASRLVACRAYRAKRRGLLQPLLWII